MKKIAKIEVINPGSPPDVDSDFGTEHRERAIEHVQEVYGINNVANIGTFGTLAGKSAFKQMCTIYEVPFAQANKIATLYPAMVEGNTATLQEVYDPNSDWYNEAADFRDAVSGPEWKKIIKGAMAIEGRNKSTGTHACGIILSNVPLDNAIPLLQRDGRIITQWTYPEAESLGLLKMDFLGLDTVDLIQNTVSNIIKNGKDAPNMIEIIHGEMDDPAVYKLFQEGHTTGIFQFGSEMVRNLLLLTKPTEFKDLPAITSVARPGPMRMQSHNKYADRKNNREEIDYIHPEFKGTVMEEILGKTYGLCIPVGTPILDASTGLYVPIEKLKEGALTTSYNHSTGQFENKKINKVFSTGKKKIVKITLNGNRILRVSETHPVLTSRGYVEARNIQASDRIVVNDQETDVNVNATISEDKAYFLGAMLGDGSFTSDNQPYFTNNDESVIQEIVKISESEFDSVYANVKPARISNNKTHCPVVMFRNYPLSERANYRHLSKKSSINNWFSELGYARKVLMYDKYIPEQLFNQPNSVLRNVVAGLWDTDGTVSKSAIHFTTTSENLYKTMKQALERLGVDYGVVEKPYVNMTRKDRTAYRIYPVYIDFEEKIQPYLRSKKRKEVSLGRTKIASNGLINFYDEICEDFYEWMKKNDELNSLSSSGANHAASLGKIGWKAGRSYLNNVYGANITSRIDFAEYVVDNNMISDQLAIMTKNRYKRVTKVEEDGFEECYDIEVADNHNFIVDGFVVHNCIYQEQVQQISNKIAGMTLQEGDDLRRAMGKKKQKVMDAMKPKFYQGAMANGFSEEAVDTLWGTLEPFAKYGFNKCLYGRTIVALPNGQGKTSIEKLYERFENGEKDIEILSMFENGEIKPHKISNIVQTGVKPLYKIKTASGKIIRLTKEHRLLTTDGYGSIENGVLQVGKDLITDDEWTKRISDETRTTRKNTMTLVNQSDEQRAKARKWMKKYQSLLTYEDRSAHQKNVQLNNPERSVKPLKAMQERLAYLRTHDLDWQNKVLENQLIARKITTNIRKGYGIPTVLSDGRVADSIAEAAAAEYLISRGIDFEMHKVFTSTHGTAKITDFYVNGLYFEMDGLRRGREYFVKEKYGKDIPFVYLTPDNFGDVIDEALLNHHIANGDEIIEIIEPKVLENGSILREMTYDIEMDTTGPANFIANGIVSHNSHAVAYAMNSYQSAYLKTHYPIEFMAALIAQHVDNKDKTLDHLREASRMGLKVSTVDINLSDIKVSPNYSDEKNHETHIFFGLAGVKAVSSAMAEIIIKEREANGEYTSVKDVIDRCYPLGVRNKRIYENLALAGAFDNFGVSRKQVFENLPQLINAAKVDENKGESLFDMFEISDDSLEINLTGEDYPFLDRLKAEADMIGLYLSSHPTAKIGQLVNSEQYTKLDKLINSTKTTTTTVIGTLLDIQVKRSKMGSKSMILNIDDGTGFLTANVAKSIVQGIDKTVAQEKIRKTYETGSGEIKTELLNAATNLDIQNVPELEKYGLYVMNVTFRPSRDDSPYGARVNWIRPLQLADDGTLPIRIRFKITKNNEEKMKKLHKALAPNLGKKIHGDSPIHTVLYSEEDLTKNNEALYMLAFDEIQKSDTEARVWPPRIPQSAHIEKRSLSTEEMVLAIENLPYEPSGFSTQKSQRVEQAIEKYVGYGAYDFGVFNPNSLDDN